MPLYIRLIRFTNVGLDAVAANTSEVAARTVGAFEGLGAKVVSAYVTLGSYDVVSVIEARDDAHVAKVDQALHELGYYVAVERASAVPLDEFVGLSRTAPVAIQAWVQGRRALDVDRSGRLPGAPAKAASPGKQRAKGIEERKVRRSTAGSSVLAWIGTEGPLKVRDLGTQSNEGVIFASLMLPADSQAAKALVDLDRGAPLQGVVLAFVATKTKLPIDAVLVRMDITKSGDFETVIKGSVPKATLEKLGLSTPS